MKPKENEYIIPPNLLNKDLTETVKVFDEKNFEKSIKVVEEKPLTIFLNDQEIITAMTIGDHPKYLALGFLFNQRIIRKKSEIKAVDYDKDLSLVVVRTSNKTNYEIKSKKKIKTSGCAMGTIFEDILEEFEKIKLPFFQISSSDIFSLIKKINMTNSLYLEAGAIHGSVLCDNERPLVYMEDVGRHNAVDKISGWIFDNDVDVKNKILYTTGRLTSEMIIKTVMMKIPILISRSGFTAWGSRLAKQSNLTLLGRTKGNRFVCLNGKERIIFQK